MPEPIPTNPVVLKASRFRKFPLYVWVMVAVVLAIPTGLLLGPDAAVV